MGQQLPIISVYGTGFDNTSVKVEDYEAKS